MMRRMVLGVCLFAAVMVHVALPAKANDELPAEEIQMILDEANSWLSKLDSHQYEEAWVHTAGLFKTSGDKEKWVTVIADGQRILGERITRKLLEQYYSKFIPTAPAGDYYTLIYATEYTQKPEAIEIIFMTRDVDGEWRVGGYVVK